MTINDINAKIKEVIDELTGTGQPLAVVYDYYKPDPKQYPVAMIEWDGPGRVERLDQASNYEQHRFSITVMLKEDFNSAAAQKRRTIGEQVIQKFNASSTVDTLRGTVERLDVTAISPLRTTDSEIASLYFVIRLDAYIIKSIT